MIVKGGKYYNMKDGELTEAEPGEEPKTVDDWVCRRKADIPEGAIPRHHAGYANCFHCGEEILYNTTRSFPDPQPKKVCMQCAGITPLSPGGKGMGRYNGMN